MEKEIEKKEADFGELELKIAKPSLAQDKTLVIKGNFEELGGKIRSVVDRYKGTLLTEENVEYVTTLKKQFTALRTGIERERKEYKKAYITPAEDLVDSMCKELLRIVDEGESALKAQLDEYDQRRKNELTVVLKEYVADSVEKYGLREEYANQIVLCDKYYNKTQKEEDSIDDIERQASELSKKQKDYDSGVELIKAECEDADLLPDTYIRSLQYKALSEILLEIKMDKKTNDELKAKAEKGEKVVIGEPVEGKIAEALKCASELNEHDNLRTRVLKITYKPEQAKIISKFFTENKISFEFLKTDF